MTLNGIDISSFQGGINLAAVPCDFVIVKATQGTSYINPDCSRAVEQALAAGKGVGIYHYISGGNAVAEMDYFFNNCKGWNGRVVWHIDWESNQNQAWGNIGYLDQAVKRLAALTGRPPMLYASSSVYPYSVAKANNCGIWIASYANMNATGYQAHPWNEDKIGGAIRQYSSSGRLPGWNGNLDLDIFYGDRNAWNSYAGAKGGVPQYAPVVAAPSAQGLNVDGSCGPSTIRRWQQVMGTQTDGLVSGQVVPDGRNYSRPALVTSCVRYGGSGSNLIRAVQKVLKAHGVYTGNIDGLLGPKVIDGLHRYLGVATPQNKPWTSFGPAVVKALQSRLNEGRF